MYDNWTYPPIGQVLEPLMGAHSNDTGLLLLENNLDAFAIRAATIRAARSRIDLQYYIWKNDLTGNLLGYELLKAADRGVHIRLLLDDLDAKNKENMLAILNQHQNIEIRLFNPTYNRTSRILKAVEWVFRVLTLNRRMHNKAWITDDQLAIVGGRNIGDEYFDASPNTNFVDLDVLLMGEAVKHAVDIFNAFWSSEAVVPLEKLAKAKRKDALINLRNNINHIDQKILQDVNVYFERLHYAPSVAELLTGERKIYWARHAHIYSDPPEKVYDHNQAHWLIHTIYPIWTNAQRSLRIISPYFVPGATGSNLFKMLCKRSVDVSILTNSLAATDVMVVHAGYAPYRYELLKSGVALYELIPHNKVHKKRLGASGASLHTKAFMVDNHISFIGSFNVDPRSIRLNTEMGILFEQPELTEKLLALYQSKTGGDSSYQVMLAKDDTLCWRDDSVTPTRVWKKEPETRFLKRALTKIMSYLPIESQL